MDFTIGFLRVKILVLRLKVRKDEKENLEGWRRDLFISLSVYE